MIVTNPLNTAQRDALRVALRYADQYHAPPLEKMRSEWKLAIEETNKLRDQLWLANRPQNSDGNSSHVNMVPGQIGPDTDKGAGSFSRTTLYDRNGTDLPSSYGQEPTTP